MDWFGPDTHATSSDLSPVLRDELSSHATWPEYCGNKPPSPTVTTAVVLSMGPTAMLPKGEKPLLVYVTHTSGDAPAVAANSDANVLVVPTCGALENKVMGFKCCHVWPQS